MVSFRCISLSPFLFAPLPMLRLASRRPPLPTPLHCLAISPFSPSWFLLPTHHSSSSLWLLCRWSPTRSVPLIESRPIPDACSIHTCPTPSSCDHSFPPIETAWWSLPFALGLRLKLSAARALVRYHLSLPKVFTLGRYQPLDPHSTAS